MAPNLPDDAVHVIADVGCMLSFYVSKQTLLKKMHPDNGHIVSLFKWIELFFDMCLVLLESQLKY